jgi:hypothetical protein
METSRRFFIFIKMEMARLLKWKWRAAILRWQFFRAKFARHVLNANVSLAWLFGSGFPKSQQQPLRNEILSRRIINPWRGIKRVLLMDILASMLAYLVSVTGIIAALAISFVVYFSPPDQQPENVVAAAKPPLFDMAAPAEIKGLKQTDLRAASKAEQAKPALPAVALDAQQKPQTSPAQLRLLADKDRAKRLAYRANTDFETRFLHYDD